jgi:SAM-dependent methyltransferase
MKIAFHTSKGTASEPNFWPDYWKTVSLQLNSKYLPELSALLNHLPPQASVLDIGCGRGVVVRGLQQRGYNARGIDFDRDSILDSVEHGGYFPSEIGDLNHLPYRSGSFDAVLLAGTVEHVFQGPQCGFSEAYRVLRPGGFIVLTIPYINIVRKLFLPFYLTRDIIFSYFPESQQEKFFEWVFTRGEVTAMLSRAGFSVSESRRAYYTTVLRKIPGVIKATEAVFRKSEISRANRTGTPSLASTQNLSSMTKLKLKPIIEGTLNMIIPNRLVVLARRP